MKWRFLTLVALSGAHCSPTSTTGSSTTGSVDDQTLGATSTHVTSHANGGSTTVTPGPTPNGMNPAVSNSVDSPLETGQATTPSPAISSCVNCSGLPLAPTDIPDASEPASSSSGTPSEPTTNGDDTGSDTASSDVTCTGEGFRGVRPEPLVLSGNTFAHDPTMIGVGDTFYRFWTGDYVPVSTSTDLRHWTQHAPVYTEYPQWVNTWRAANPGNTFNFPWAPDVSYFGGKYHLYTSFSAFFGRNISCIGHLTTDDPRRGQWTDHGTIICSEGTERYNAIDADVGLDAEGNPWLAFGSFWDGIFMFPLEQDGSRKGDALTHLAKAREIEAPVLFYRCGYYYLLVTWGLCCPGEGRSVDDLSYRVVVGRSQNIIGPYVDRNGVPLTEGGGTLLVEGDGVRFAAAGHSDVLTHDGTMYHLYHAYRQRDAGAELRIVELPFDDEGWPLGGAP